MTSIMSLFHALCLAVLLPISIATSIEEAFATSYAPVYVDCPADIEWIRPAVGLNPKEANWVQGRKPIVLAALEGYLERLALDDFSVDEYIDTLYNNNYTNVPTIAMAISGGGWASALTGVGAMRAFDDRLTAATTQGTGGLLQSLTYLAGLSGGSFPVLSSVLYDFPTIDELVANWHVQINSLEATNTTAYAADPTTLVEQIAKKYEAGFNISFPDYLGRAVAYEFIPGANGGLNVTFSSLVNSAKFVAHQMPFPILQTGEITAGDATYFNVSEPTANSTIYDLTPFEYGSWDGNAKVFTPTQWLGTRLFNGSVINSSACVLGFDRASFMMGSTSAGFNLWYIEDFSNFTEGGFAKRSLQKRASFPEEELGEFTELFAEVFGLNVTSITYAVWPNPFLGLSSSSSLIKESEDLRVVDGSESGQSIPLWGLIQPDRDVDFIIVWEDVEDASPYNWNNGTNLYNTYIQAEASGLPFPIIPPANTMINYNYSVDPVFFGCDANLTTTNSTDSPIILYLKNAPYSAYTNYSYTQGNVSIGQMNDILINSFNEVTLGNGTLGDEWVSCLGCAVIDRSLGKIGKARTAQCEKCLTKYCWNGTYNDTLPAPVNPSLLLDPSYGFDEWNLTHSF